MGDIRLLAIDWGTTSARAYALDADGGIVSERNAPLGVQNVKPGGFGEALRILCDGELATDIPLIASGMIGSRQGWAEAPYCECPAGFYTVAAALIKVPQTRLVIVPGLTCRGADGVPDVIRGEETQVFGALPEDVSARQVIVLPGTH